ncbi:MAG: hypothetical protein ACREJX_00185 [Polyangiaceae bacterium]
MATQHDTDPKLPPPPGRATSVRATSSTDPNYPAALGERPSYGKLNYGPQMRAETDPDFLTPPGGVAARKADTQPDLSAPSSEDVSDGSDSRGALRARHQAGPRSVRRANNDTVKMESAVQVNETVRLPDAMVGPEIVARRKRKLRRDQMTELNSHGRKKVERKLLGAAIWGVLAAAVVIALSEFLLK